jgi:hypothetical protein
MDGTSSLPDVEQNEWLLAKRLIINHLTEFISLALIILIA